jgi:hypothetical protein
MQYKITNHDICAPLMLSACLHRPQVDHRAIVSEVLTCGDFPLYRHHIFGDVQKFFSSSV